MNKEEKDGFNYDPALYRIPVQIFRFGIGWGNHIIISGDNERKEILFKIAKAGASVEFWLNESEVKELNKKLTEYLNTL